jgi:PAS domain S-box-containing protein
MATQFQETLRDLYSHLTHPPVSSANVEDNLHMQLISGFFLFQTVIAFLIVIAYVPLQANTIAIPSTLGFGILSTLCYLISRTHYYKLSILLYITLMVVSLFTLYITNNQQLDAIPEYTLSYLIAVIFFTSLLLSVRATVIVASISLAGIALLPLAISELDYPLHFLWLFTFVTSILIIVTMLIRQNILHRLQESENKARSLMEAYIDAVVIHSNNRGILAVNPAFTDLLGYTSDDILGKSFDTFANDEPSRTLIRQNSQLDYKSAPYEVQLSHQSNESIIVDLISQPYIFDNQPAHVFIMRDMRKYKEVLRQQHEQEIRYESLLELTDDAVFISDFEGTYVAVNQQTSNLLGIPVEELVGKSFHDFIPKVYHTASQRVIERLLVGEPVPMYERTFIKANGHRFPAEVMIRLLCDVDGNPQYIHSVVRDITERKKAEDQRVELVVERERMGTVQHFLRDASHYFRTPLTSLKTSQYLLTKVRDNEEKQIHFLDVMKIEIARLEHLISDMMLSAQLEQDVGNGLTFGRLDLAEILTEIVQTFSPSEKRATYADIIIQPEIPPKTFYLMASRAKIFVAIHRLLENAITYSPADSTIIIHAYQQEQNVCIAITDKGIGITEEEMPMLFQRFCRADRAIEMAHVGNGLGLFITQKIIEMHYGEIKVESILDKGSTFTIILPMALRPQKRPSSQPTQQSP